MAYFFTTMPSVYLPEPKVPQLPALPRQTINVKDKNAVIKLIKETIPYLNILEKYHVAVYRLISHANESLDRIITR